MKDRLQIRFDSHLYNSVTEIRNVLDREKANNLMNWALKSEPIVFFYKDSESDKTNAVLAIGLDGDGNGVVGQPTNDYFLIDVNTLRKDIDEVSGHTGDSIELISGMSETISNIISSLGFEDDGTLDWHRHPEDLSHEYSGITEVHQLLSLMIKDIKDNFNNKLTLEYDSEEGVIWLLSNGEKVGDPILTSDFVKDGMLEKVDVINTEAERERDPEGYATDVPYIVFYWNDDSDEVSIDPSRISLKTVFNPYTNGDGLNLVGNEFSIKIDEANSERFLSVERGGLKVTGIQEEINKAKAEAKTKVEKESSASHITLTHREEADSSITYVIGETDIASKTALDDEIVERINLKSYTENLERKVGAESARTDALSTSVTALSAKDSELEQRIQTEENRRLADDNALSTRIDAVLTALTVESGRAVTEETRIAGLVEAERARSTEVDETISGHVVNLKEQVTTAVSDIDGLKANSVLGVNPSDKMLTITDNLISSTFDVEYDQEHKQIRFIGKNNSILGTVSTSDFVLDGMIDSVSVSTEADEKYLVFVFNTDAGKETIKVKVTDFMKEYSVESGSTGFISIEDYKIGVKTNTTDNSGLATESQLHDLKDIVGSGFNEPGQEHTLTQKIREIEERLNDTALEEDVEAVKADVDKIKNVLSVQLKTKAVSPKAEIALSFSNTPNGTKYIEVGTKAKPIITSLYTDGKYVMANGSETNARNEINQNNTVKSIKRKLNDVVEEINVNNVDENYIVKDGTYSASAVIVYNDGITDPLDVFGNVDETIRIPAGTINCETEEEIKAYRPIYCGTFNPENYGEINAATIEEMISNGVITKLQSYSWEEEKKAGRPDYVKVQAGTKAVVIAVPNDNDRFVGGEVKAILDDKDHGFNIKDEFDMHRLTSVRTYDGDASGYAYVAYVYQPSTEMEESSFKVIY